MGVRELHYHSGTLTHTPTRPLVLTLRLQVPPEELAILVVMDSDMVYDQNFYICGTEEVAQAVIDKFTTVGGAAGATGEGGEAAVEEEAAEPRPQEIVDPDLVNRPWIEWSPEGADAKHPPKKTTWGPPSHPANPNPSRPARTPLPLHSITQSLRMQSSPLALGVVVTLLPGS